MKEKKVNLLRVFVKKSGKKSEDTTSYTFDHKIFIPLRFHEIESIKITVRDEEDKELETTSGHLFASMIMRPLDYI